MTHPRALRRNQATFAALAETLTHSVQREHPPHTISEKTPARRDAHPKHHGCVEATFTVDDIGDDLRCGVFQPKTTYRALIRFSNAFKVRHDLDRDARGMAIKLLDVKGDRVRLPDLDGKAPVLLDEGVATQDFLLVTHSEFFGADAAEFLEIASAIVASKSMILIGVRVTRCFFGLFPFRFRWRNAWALFRSFKWTSNPLYLEYFSQTPYRFAPRGPATLHARAAKFCVRPLQHVSVRELIAFWRMLAVYWVKSLTGKTRWQEDCLRHAVHEYLATRSARFEFCVQRRTNPDRMPLNNATRRWPKRLSEYKRVAIISIEPDLNYRDPKFVEPLLRRGEHLTFSPWHAVEEHRPLGSINRARLFTYARVSAMRHQLNIDAGIPAQHRPTTAAGVTAGTYESRDTYRNDSDA